MYPYVPPQVQTAEEIETETDLIDEDFIDLKTKYNEVNGVATEQKKQQQITNLVDDVIDENSPFQNLRTEDIWIEADLFDINDSKETTEISNDTLKNISKNDPFLDFTVQIEQVISDIFDDVNVTDDKVTEEKVTVKDVTDDEVTAEDVIDNEIVSVDALSDDEEPEEISAVPANVQWNPKKTTVSADTRPRTYLSTYYSSAVRVANKIKNKYRKKILRKRNLRKTWPTTKVIKSQQIG